MIDITNIVSSIDLSKIQFDYNSKVILSLFIGINHILHLHLDHHAKYSMYQ